MRMTQEKTISLEELPGLVPEIEPAAWIAESTGLPVRHVAACVQLLDDGATVPFISRYRKEMTGGMDEVAVTRVRDALHDLREFCSRRISILESVAEQGKLTPALLSLFLETRVRSELEDLYLPYKRRRLTRADKARNRGLEPLSRVLSGLEPLPAQGLEALAAAFINPELEVHTAQDAIDGACDICAETVSEHAPLREALRALMRQEGRLRSTVIHGKEDQAQQFRDYYDYSEPVLQAPSHRVLAVCRGENEEFLRVHVVVEDERALGVVARFFPAPDVRLESVWARIRKDAWERLLNPSIESELRREIKEKADAEAIAVFVANLRELLMAPPLGARRVMALDPGFRTGCKVAVLNAQGTFLAHKTIYPHPPREEREYARKVVAQLVEEYHIEAIAVGNGTAGRETEAFLREMVREGMLPKSLPIVRVDESGASIYSASELARGEFPDLDLTVRGAISIGRRMQDPLGELVKIDPKSIGVGQYQHDVDQARLRRALDDVVESCVNLVGVELNTASASLLQYVSGVGEKLAQAIVAFREQNGPFSSRRDLLRVPRLGPKAFEQCAGFVRVREGAHPLDASAVHPERYGLVEAMAADLGVPVADLIGNAALVDRILLERYVSEDVGMYTLRDIVEELKKPGRDPRRAFEEVGFREDVMEFEDLQEGMILTGVVTNVTAFGAFVDIGVHQDGLVHVSELSHTFVRDPLSVVKPGQKVTVKVIGLDPQRRRIALSIRACTAPPADAPAAKGRREKEDRRSSLPAESAPSPAPPRREHAHEGKKGRSAGKYEEPNPFARFFSGKK